MNSKQFERERQYQAALAIAKAMLKNGIVTAMEYEQIKAVLTKKFHPITGFL